MNVGFTSRTAESRELAEANTKGMKRLGNRRAPSFWTVLVRITCYHTGASEGGEGLKLKLRDSDLVGLGWGQ